MRTLLKPSFLEQGLILRLKRFAVTYRTVLYNKKVTVCLRIRYSNTHLKLSPHCHKSKSIMECTVQYIGSYKHNRYVIGIM